MRIKAGGRLEQSPLGRRCSMNQKSKIVAAQRVIQICLLLIAAISVWGGWYQLSNGQPGAPPNVDSNHRFMAGLYLSMAPLTVWVAVSIRQHSTLIYFIALSVLFAALGRVYSIYEVGHPGGAYTTYLIAEFVLPVVLVVCQFVASRQHRGSIEQPI
ncbi:MAG: DUF4345 domain-containing protein [Pseudomonadota bacterium]